MNEPTKDLEDTYQCSMINEPKTTKTVAHKSKRSTYHHGAVAELPKSLPRSQRSCMAAEQSKIRDCTYPKLLGGNCMVAEPVRENGSRARKMTCHDGKLVETWDLNKTKVRICVDRTKWQKRYPCRSRLVQRLRRQRFSGRGRMQARRARHWQRNEEIVEEIAKE